MHGGAITFVFGFLIYFLPYFIQSEYFLSGMQPLFRIFGSFLVSFMQLFGLYFLFYVFLIFVMGVIVFFSAKKYHVLQ